MSETFDNRDPVCIVGIGCRLPPDCEGADAFWDLLRSGRCAVRDIPLQRWPHETGIAPRRAALLDDSFPEYFDAGFFDIAPTEAVALDPQQRLLLEVCWRALEDAGLPPDARRGRSVGVYVAMSTTDYQNAILWGGGLQAAGPFAATGLSHAAAAGRLSYTFGFEGPSLAVDTACSSSLVAFHLACQALRQGECEAALVAGVNALLAPNLFIGLSQMGLLAADGRCKAFDAAGDGYGRAEGAGALVLKRLSAARAAGDRVLAVCRGSAVNQDGRSNGLTAPRRGAQEGVIRTALARAGLSGADIGYVEAHGTGTPLGDAVEMAALGATYGAGRHPARPLLVGSAKTNIGHLEAGAGIAGLIKAVLCLRHGEIPAHLHLDDPSPHIDWSAHAIRVPTEITPWPRGGQPRRAGISSFGFSGTNAHVILEEAPPPEPRTGQPPPTTQVLPLSARSREALRAQAERYLAFLVGPAAATLADVCHTAGAGRCHFALRLAVIGRSPAGMAAALRRYLDGLPEPDVVASGAVVHGSGDTASGDTAEDLARRYVAGDEVDWAALAGPYAVRKTAIPSYPFQRRPYYRFPVGAANGHRAPAPPSPVSPRAETRASVDELRRLVDETARRVLSDRPSAPLDPDRPLAEQGFTSLLGVELCTALEAACGVPLPSSATYNYPSIGALAAFLASEVARRGQHQDDRAPTPRPPETPACETGADYRFLDDLSLHDLERLVARDLQAS